MRLPVCILGLLSGIGACIGPGFPSLELSKAAPPSQKLDARSRAPAPNSGSASRCNHVSQWGITWNFDLAYTCGQFANGDYWVIPNVPGGRVRITSISPAHVNGRNGWMVNPTSITFQGFDQLAPGYQPSLVPPLPYDAAPGSSIIKAISNSVGCDGGDRKTCLTTAAVLTVISAVPPDNGTSVFRPPYFGTQKPIFSTNAIDWSTLPSFASLSKVPISLADALATVQRVQLAFKNDWVGDQIHPSENFKLTDPYGPDISNQNVNAALRAMLKMPGDLDQDRKGVVISLIQYGVDNYGVLINGAKWTANGGHDMGMRLPSRWQDSS